MEISIEELLKGKATKIKENGYFETAKYVEPFLERMESFTEQFVVNVKEPNQITLTSNGEINLEDITYNRVYVQAVLKNEFSVENHKEVVGMVYGIDTRVPVVKFYKGAINCACTNLCVFNPDALFTQELKPLTAINFKPIQRLLELTEDTSVWVNKLKSTPFSTDTQDVNESLGQWVRNCINLDYNSGFGKVKLATSVPVDAYKLLFTKKDSPYLIKEGETPTMFKVYNAFTQLITDALKKDVINQCEKTLLLKQILSLD